MRVLVTGGAGYVGSHTVRSLLDAGHECVVLDTLERGWAASVDRRAKLIVGSVEDSSTVASALQGCQCVIHCAGYIDVAESQREPEMYRQVNATGPKALLDAMVEADVQCLVFSSTAAVYGEPAVTPIVESMPLHPINAYGASKLEFERMISDYSSRGLRCVTFRYFNVAGAWPDGSMGEAHEPETHIIPRVLCGLRDGATSFEVFGSDYPTRDGTCVRDYIHVCDLADAHRRGAESLLSGAQGDIFNLGSGRGYTNLEVLTVCSEVAGRPISVEQGPRRPGDPATLLASNEKAVRVLGWVPERSDLAAMISDAWRWHLAHGTGYR